MMILTCLLGLLAQDSEEAPVRHNIAGIRYRLWLASFSGSVRSDSSGVDGTDVRLDADLGVDEFEVLHSIGGWFHIPHVGNIRADWTFGKFDGSETLSQNLNFGGTTFTGDSQVDTDVTFHLISLLFELELWGEDDFGIDAGIWLQLGGKLVIADTELTSDYATEEGRLIGGLPVVGIRGAVAISDLFRAEAEVNGFIFPGGTQALRFVDASIELDITPWEGLTFGIGFRILNAYAYSESGDDVDETDLTLAGLFFSAGWRF